MNFMLKNRKFIFLYVFSQWNKRCNFIKIKLMFNIYSTSSHSTQKPTNSDDLRNIVNSHFLIKILNHVRCFSNFRYYILFSLLKITRSRFRFRFFSYWIELALLWCDVCEKITTQLSIFFLMDFLRCHVCGWCVSENNSNTFLLSSTVSISSSTFFLTSSALASDFFLLSISLKLSHHRQHSAVQQQVSREKRRKKKWNE